MKKKIAAALAVIVFAVLACAVVLGVMVKSYATTALNPQGKEIRFEVPRGWGMAATARELEKAGIIRRPRWFALVARRQGADARIRAGEYLLSPAMPPLEVLETLVRGKTILYKLTIPEGLTMPQTASLAEKEGFCNAGEFLARASSPLFAASLGVEQGNLEGYLFPETYLFPKGEKTGQIIQAMVRRFNAVFNPEWKERAAQLGMTVHEIVTLASIIEKETGVAWERPLISSVFHNRLQKGMLLQSDPTVIYGIPDFNGNITRKHLEEHSPYNTYVIQGLPPGPIASPGRDALEAALYPAKTKYLFFVAKKDGTHQFSINLQDHNRAVRKYQLGKG